MSKYFNDWGLDEEILHYGVKGMKWGKKNAKSTYSGNVPTGNRPRGRQKYVSSGNGKDVRRRRVYRIQMGDGRKFENDQAKDHLFTGDHKVYYYGGSYKSKATVTDRKGYIVAPNKRTPSPRDGVNAYAVGKRLKEAKEKKKKKTIKDRIKNAIANW